MLLLTLGATACASRLLSAVRNPGAPGLAATRQQIGQGRGLGVRQRAQRGIDAGAEAHQDRGVDGIGLGQDAERSCKVAHLAWIHDHDRQSGGGHGRHGGPLVSAGGLENNQARGNALEPRDQRRVALGIVVKLRGGRGGSRLAGHIQTGLADIDADNGCSGIRHDHSLPCECGLARRQRSMRLSGMGSKRAGPGSRSPTAFPAKGWPISRSGRGWGSLATLGRPNRGESHIR